MNVLLTVAYDGTNYAGWQRQENAIAIQQRLEEAISGLFGEIDETGRMIKVTGASRTDAGVHALGQRASFIAQNMPIPLDKIPRVLNSRLPADIAVQAAQVVPDDFNPRFCAKAKTYCYRIYNAPCPNPLEGRYSAFVPSNLSSELDVEKMARAAKYFVGTHDFAAFCASGSSAKTTTRTIFACSVERERRLQEGPFLEESLIKMTVTGDGFLYNMVRIMAGTLLYVGMGKSECENIPAIIASKDRTLAGKTMPPEGLVLVEVMYE